jgi:hypothetical protein
MLKKMAFIALAMAVVLGSIVSMATAAQNVANTSQKGSLLIWPLVTLAWQEPEGYTEGPIETYISIGNDYYSDVWVKCYWVDQEQQIQDFMFRLTPNQPIWFRASDGTGGIGMTVPPFNGPSGELKCWAVNAVGDSSIAFNHLYGSALISNPSLNVAFQYNAWSFTARGVAQGAAVGTPGAGRLDLTGAAGAYDACPSYLVDNFIAQTEDPDEFEPALALVPCKQDLRQDRTPTCTKAKFDVWNENETKYTGAYRCLKCWIEFELGEIANTAYTGGYGFGNDKFTFKGLHTWMGRFRVNGVASTVCNGKIAGCAGVAQVATPFLGVLWHELSFAGADEMWVGTTPHTAGADGAGFVLWDPQSEPPTAPAAN